jgi:arylsulfatase A-like enzyme
MLQVPFVLRLPPSLQDRSVDTDRLVTLADIFPTLLGTAGIAHRTAGGVNLLAPANPTGGRFAVTRTTGVRPDVGLRSLRWSLILDPAGSRGLYDLTVDPGEVDDLALRQPARLMGLGRILSHRIAQPPRLAVGDGSADISRGDRELLEVLGYVRD